MRWMECVCVCVISVFRINKTHKSPSTKWIRNIMYITSFYNSSQRHTLVFTASSSFVQSWDVLCLQYNNDFFRVVTKRSKKTTAAMLTTTPITIIQQNKNYAMNEQRHRKFVYLLLFCDTKFITIFIWMCFFALSRLVLCVYVLTHKKFIMICINLRTRLKVSRWNRYYGY